MQTASTMIGVSHCVTPMFNKCRDKNETKSAKEVMYTVRSLTLASRGSFPLSILTR
jgi:hypothetical protein